MRPTVLLCTLVLLAGCSQYRAPQFSVTGVSVADRTAEATAVAVAVDLTNPNDEPLELLQLTYAFSVDGTEVFRGRRAAEATLARGATRRLVLPAVIPGDAPLGPGPAHAFTIKGHVHYVTPGELAEILLDIGLRRPRVRFASSGDLSLE